MSWSQLFEWWLGEVAGDPAYEEVVTPLLLEVLRPEEGLRYLDVGCGEGRVMRVVGGRGATVTGLDLSYELVSHAGSGVVADLIAMPLRDDWFDGVYSVLTLEHVEDHGAFFSEAARVIKPGGVLALVINHPTWTAPGSTPISDSDGEVLWRPGDYFSKGSSEVPAGESAVTFHHRSMAVLLNAAADAGWGLDQMIEQPHHEFEDQAGIPRLLACRWRLK
ncbi:MAG TPA: class I SAM-dependent methyltransferase [Acidimicrobiia bacterium]|nr:class I SAM-dependent methyltransferase [Acidimicrobiia bacterium]